MNSTLSVTMTTTKKFFCTFTTNATAATFITTCTAIVTSILLLLPLLLELVLLLPLLTTTTIGIPNMFEMLGFITTNTSPSTTTVWRLESVLCLTFLCQVNCPVVIYQVTRKPHSYTTDEMLNLVCSYYLFAFLLHFKWHQLAKLLFCCMRFYLLIKVPLMCRVWEEIWYSWKVSIWYMNCEKKSNKCAEAEFFSIITWWKISSSWLRCDSW